MHIMQDYVQNMQDYSKWIGQYVNGIKDIRLWGLFDKVHSSFEIQKDNELDSLKRKSILTFLNMNIDNLLIELVIIGIYVIGVDFAKKEMITIGGIIVFITYCTYILAPLSSVFNIIFVLSGIKPSIARVNKFMEEDEEISEDNVHVNEISSISFNNVSFSYNDFEVLSAVSLKLSKGQKVVIFGKNGCGKTTLVNLLLRIENANKGQIYVNNISINKLDIDLYRKQLAVVSTEFYLFNDTILNNICVDTTADYNKLNNIITVCGLNELIEQRGMDFLVGENGEYLSAGQRQRVCLARALISNRDYLFLDEATSNLDVESKNRVLEYLLRVNKGMIIISHDLDIFRIVDKIVYMKEGHINDQGTLAELMSRNESFKKEICEL